MLLTLFINMTQQRLRELGNLPKVTSNGIHAPLPPVQTHDFSITSYFSKSGSRATCAAPESYHRPIGSASPGAGEGILFTLVQIPDSSSATPVIDTCWISLYVQPDPWQLQILRVDMKTSCCRSPKWGKERWHNVVGHKYTFTCLNNPWAEVLQEWPLKIALHTLTALDNHLGNIKNTDISNPRRFWLNWFGQQFWKPPRCLLSAGPR